MPRITKLVSFWVFVVLAALLALQFFPFTGLILMFLGASLMAGALVHVFLIALLAEAVIGRISRAWIMIPVVAYGAYYATYAQQVWEIASKSAELRANNPGKILPFDPAVHSLVVANDAEALVSFHEIPVAYEANANFQPEGHLSLRLIRRDQCNVRKDTEGRIVTLGMHFENKLQTQVCVLRFPQAPSNTIIEAVTRNPDEIWRRNWGISEQTTELTLGGKPVASYRTASVWRLPALPTMAIGCFLVSSTPAWKCGADFMRTYTVIDAVPGAVDRTRYDTPVSVMLGLRKYTAGDLANFRGFAQNEAALKQVSEEPRRIEDGAFDVLQAIVEGHNPKPTFNMPYSVASNPARLSPMAVSMARRFAELIDPAAQGLPNRNEQLLALAGGLAALPRDVFPAVARSVFEAIRADDMSWDHFNVLYIRAADSGTDALEFYQNDFMTLRVRGYNRILPVLAICRIGRASDAVIAEMKQRFLTPQGAGFDSSYPSSLAVALIKLGQEDFVRANAEAFPARSRPWLDAVLDKQGVTETGPNNCMMERWSSSTYLPSTMAPALEWQRGQWSARTRG
jgi:hypothetical protein